MNPAFIAGMIGSLIFSIFLSGIEVAFLSANKVQIELQGKQGNAGGKIMSFFVKKPTWFIGTTLIGNIASLILFGIFATLSLLSWLDATLTSLSISALIPIIVLTFTLSVVILYTVEFFSKSFFIINSNRMVKAMAVPFAILSTILFPVVFSVISLARFIIDHVFGVVY